jgi:hypothetical protein
VIRDLLLIWKSEASFPRIKGERSVLLIFLAVVAALDYGAPPTYDEGVKIGEAFIKHDLADPYSAHIEWPYNFVPIDEKIPFSKRATGYATCVTVNAKNAYGGYIGERQYRIIIRNGSVIDYAQVSDLRFVPDICKELTTKYGMGSAPAPQP